MTPGEQTVQRRDPVSGVNGLPLTVIGSIGAVLYAILMTALNRQDIDYPLLTVIALAAVLAAFSLLAVAASPLRPPVSRAVHVGGLALLLGAMALNAASMAQSNLYIQDDWGSLVIGLFGLFISPYRPPRELIAFSVLAAVFAGFIALLQVPSFATPIPPFAFVVIAVTPLLALSLAGAAYASEVLRITARWQNRAEQAVQQLAIERLGGITRSVQQDRVTILNQDVVPFFTGVLERDEVTGADRVRAAAIASRIRSMMVHEVDRTWLEAAVDELRAGGEIRDPDRLADAIAGEGRSAIRALIVALVNLPEFDPGSLRIGFERVDDQVLGTLEAAFTPTDARAILSPYLAVIRVVFPACDVELSATSLTVRFEYDQP